MSHRKFSLAIYFTYGNYILPVNNLSSSYLLLCPSPNPHHGPELPLGKNLFLLRCLTIENLSSLILCGLCQYKENQILSNELLKKLHTHSFCIVLALRFKFRLAGNLVMSGRFPTNVLNGIKNGCTPIYQNPPPTKTTKKLLCRVRRLISQSI